ncbi:hypothetical protein [uncultured Ornithinimicrobium sp.]|uniref:hypothetical protein n=1 Tax=uncultured Ornithinimicrobium sp. TaxID=259307 RepID=UPI0025927037|nr:hypothetical protein [uncultured Ornithinimicrobium sp.]
MERPPAMGRGAPLGKVPGREFGPRRALVLLAAMVPAAALLVACDRSVDPRPAPASGVSGRMVSVDDTGLPPSPAGGGGMLLVPEDSVDELSRLVGLPEADQLAYTTFGIEPEAVAELGGHVVEVDRRGHFVLTQTGRFLLCRMPDPEGSGTPPGGVRGCDVVDLPASGTLRATFGEGGFSASVR